MNTKTFPVVFSGHGSPMLALEDDAVTHGLHDGGDQILHAFGRPKAILAASAHWVTRGTFVQRAETPKQAAGCA